jgi:predicted Fe-Mo cluster-binding NifX family protein
MSYRIAIASNNGESVNQHFDQANNFLIYEIGEERAHFIEDREVYRDFEEEAHSDENPERVITLLKDCSAVFVLKISMKSSRYLYEHGIKTFEVHFLVNHILKILLKNQQRGIVKIL